MSKFNSVIKNKPNKQTYEGASAFERDVSDAWFNFLFSSFLENQYYEIAISQQKRFIQLTEKVAEQYGYRFLAKAAIFARNELGMRSISQLLAAWLNDKNFDNKRNFYRTFMRRPDDVSEIFAALGQLGQKRSHALINGSRDYLSNLNEYSIMKYKMLGHDYNMYDLINITHATSDVINKFKKDKLSSPDTWEVKISTAKTAEERNKEWIRLVDEHKLGYMALLRNLSNILKANPSEVWIEHVLAEQIINDDAIQKSLVFPYRIYSAYKNLTDCPKAIRSALNLAFIKACRNVPKFKGKSAVILDVSGSMSNMISYKSNISLKEIGACFAVTLFTKGNVDIIKFGSNAKRFSIDFMSDTLNIIDDLVKNDDLGYGTNLEGAYEIMSQNYDRIFLISDMQIFKPTSYGERLYKKWNERYGNINTYSFDLANYDNQFLSKHSNLIYLTSLSDTIFKYLEISEGNESVYDIINNYVDF